MLDSLAALLEKTSVLDTNEQSPVALKPSEIRRRALALDLDTANHRMQYPYGIPYWKRKESQTQANQLRISLKPQYNTERLNEELCPKNYFDPVKRELYRLQVSPEGAFIYNQESHINRSFVYVLYLDDRLYGSYDKKMHHTYFSSGFDLKGAGVLYCHEGKLITVSNESGHYRPTFELMQESIKWFLLQSKQPSILFEDHSIHDVTQTLEGIRYFQVSIKKGTTDTLEYTLLNGQQLLDYLRRVVLFPSSSTFEYEPENTTECGEQEHYYSNADASMDEKSFFSIDWHPLLQDPRRCSLTCIPDFYCRKGAQRSRSRFWGGKSHPGH